MAWTVVFAVILSLGTAVAAYWPFIERQYYLLQLRDTPSLFEEFLMSRKETQSEAARLFVRGKKGKRALFELYIREYERTSVGYGVREHLLRDRERGLVCGTMGLRIGGYSMTSYSGPTLGKRSVSMGLPSDDPRRRAAILELMDAATGDIYRTESLPGFEFQIVPVQEDQRIAPDWSGSDARSRGGSQPPIVVSRSLARLKFICFYRVVENEPQREVRGS